MEPQVALRTYLAEHPPSAEDPLRVLFGIRRTPPPLPSPLPEGMTVGAFLPGRGLSGIETVRYYRMSYDEICRSFLNGSLRVSAVVACCTPPDAHGVRSLGMVSGYLQLALDRAEVVVLEEVPWLPRIAGAARITRDAQVVPTSQRSGDDAVPLAGAPGHVDRLIARNVVSLIPAAPVLALGIGRVAEAVATYLRDRTDLTITTGVVTEAVRGLVDAGAVADRNVRTMSVVGPTSLLAWAAESGRVELMPSTQIHNPRWLAGHPRFITMLGGINIDPAGNLNSEQVAGHVVSGMGGAPDFAAGAHSSEGGVCIVALRTTDRDGRSNLVETVSAVTVAGRNVDAVATELGLADLRGLSASERRTSIRAIFGGLSVRQPD